jgi:hypothetical protein
MGTELRGQLTAGQRLLLARKVHLAPGALARMPGNQGEPLGNGWHVALFLIGQLAGMPQSALAWWAAQGRGHVVLTDGAVGYVVNSLSLGRRTLDAAVQVPLSVVVAEPERAAALALQPLDHLLGCRGQPDGLWLSQGAGLNSHWLAVGEQIARLFPLGYGLSRQGRADPHTYLAEGIVAALRDHRRLNIADPKLHRLLKSTILNEGFWHHWAPTVAVGRDTGHPPK